MMKIGVRAHDFGRREPETLSQAIKEAGFDAVQLALTKAIDGIGGFREVTSAHLSAVGESFRKNGVEISVLGCYIEPALPDREARLEQVASFLLGLEHAKALDVAVVATETTHFDPAPANQPRREAAYQNLKDSVLRMVEKAEKLDVQIAVETVAEHTLHSAAMTRRLLDEVDSEKLRVILDPVNLLLPGDEARQEAVYRDFLEQVGGEIAALHMKDVVFEGGEKIWRRMGAGIVEYGHLLSWLRENKPDLSLLREHVKMDSYAADIAVMRELAGQG